MQHTHEILVIGLEGAGKTRLIKRLLNQPYREGEDENTSCSIRTPNVDKTIAYREIGADGEKLLGKYLKQVHQIYIVFDVSKTNSTLEDLKKYIDGLPLPERYSIVLVGTHLPTVGSNIDVENAATVYAARNFSGDYVSIDLTSESSITNAALQRLRDISMSLHRDFLDSGPPRSVIGGSQCGDYRVLTDQALNMHNDTLRQQSRRPGSTHSSSAGGVDDLRARPSLNGAKHKRTTSVEGSETGRRVEELSNKVTTPPRLPRNRGYGDENARRTPPRLNPTTQESQSSTIIQQTRNSSAPAPANGYSFALRMAGMAMILAAVIGLLYIALVIANVLSATVLISLMNAVVAGIGSLFGASASTSLMTIGQLSASLNLSITTVAGMFMAAPTVGVLAAGFGLFRRSQSVEANTQNSHAQSEAPRAGLK